VLTALGVAVATYYVLKAMDKIFGKMVYPEKKVVKRTLLVVGSVVVWRIFGFLTLLLA